MSVSPGIPLGGPPNLGNVNMGAVVSALQQLHTDNLAILARLQQNAPPALGAPASPVSGAVGGMALGSPAGTAGGGSLINAALHLIGDATMHVVGNVTLNAPGGIAGGAGSAGASVAAKEAKEREEEGFGRKAIAILQAAAGAAMKTSQGTRGEESVGVVVSAISDIASSKTTWDLLLNTTKGIFSVAADMYNLSKTRTQQQLMIASGSSQFLRFANDQGSLERSKAILKQLEIHDQSFTPKEAQEMGSTLGAVRRQLPSFDTSDSETVTAAMRKLGTVAVYVGKSMQDLGNIAADHARRSGQDLPAVLAQIQEAGAAIDALGAGTKLSRTKFVEDTLAVTESLRSLRFSIKDSAALVGKWAMALQEGTLSLSQLVQMAQGHRTADTGTMAYLSKGIVEQVNQNAERILGKQMGGQVIAALAAQNTAVGKGYSANVLRGGAEASLAAKELGITGSESQLKKMGIMFEKFLDVELRRVSELAGGPDAGSRMFLRQKMMETIAVPVGRNTTGSSYNVRETERRQGLHADAAGGGIRINEDMGRASRYVGEGKIQSVVEQTNASINLLRRDTNGLVRDAAAKLDNLITNTAQATKDIATGWERLIKAQEKSTADAAKLLLEGVKEAIRDAGETATQIVISMIPNFLLRQLPGGDAVTRAKKP